MNAGWNAQIDEATVNNVTPVNNNMNFEMGDNIILSNNNEAIRIATSKNLTVDTVTINSSGIDAGGTKITNVKAGDVSESSTDAVNGAQLYQVEQAAGTSINEIGHNLDNLSNRVDKVGAGTVALAALHPLDFDSDDQWDFAAGYGHYSGAVAIGAFCRPNEDTMFSLGAAMANGEDMWNAGILVKLGQGNNVSTSRMAMAKEITHLKKDNAQI